MIHSTAGGKLKEYSYYDIAKVKYKGTDQAAFVLCPIKEVKENDLVEVENEFKARVIRVDRNVYEQNFPFKIKRLKKITKIISEN
mgnify:FL=1